MIFLYDCIILLLTGFYTVLMLYYWRGWLKLKIFNLSSPAPAPHTKVSVLIPARNEEKNITRCVKDALAQNYPSELFEVIVIDDFSEDKTVELLREIQSIHLRILQLKDFIQHENFNSFKKKALETGINNSKGDLMVATDADCTMGKNWLSTIVSFYEKEDVKFISGPVTITPIEISDKNSLLKKFQAVDLMGMVGMGAASLANNFPLMCNGANLAYEKKAFQEVGGFSGVDNIASGDDMLLMHKIAEKYPAKIGFIKSRDAMVYTLPQLAIKDFFNQRIRWASKSTAYKNRNITLILSLVFLFNFFILMNLLLWIISGLHFKQLFFIQLGLKLIFDFLFLTSLNKFFRIKNLFWLFLHSQILHIFYIALVGIAGIFVSRYDWKGRKVK